MFPGNVEIDKEISFGDEEESEDILPKQSDPEAPTREADDSFYAFCRRAWFLVLVLWGLLCAAQLILTSFESECLDRRSSTGSGTVVVLGLSISALVLFFGVLIAQIFENRPSSSWRPVVVSLVSYLFILIFSGIAEKYRVRGSFSGSNQLWVPCGQDMLMWKVSDSMGTTRTTRPVNRTRCYSYPIPTGDLIQLSHHASDVHSHSSNCNGEDQAFYHASYTGLTYDETEPCYNLYQLKLHMRLDEWVRANKKNGVTFEDVRSTQDSGEMDEAKAVEWWSGMNTCCSRNKRFAQGSGQDHCNYSTWYGNLVYDGQFNFLVWSLTIIVTVVGVLWSSASLLTYCFPDSKFLE